MIRLRRYAVNAAFAKLVAGRNHSHSHGHHGHSHQCVFDKTTMPLAVTQDQISQGVAACKRVTLFGVALNASLCGSKFVVGTAGGSVAMVADAIHAFVDVASSLISYTAVTIADLKLPKCMFPFGVGRMETSGAVMVSAILLFGGFGLLFAALKKIRAIFCQHEKQQGSGTAVEEREHSHSHGDATHGHSHFTLTQKGADGKHHVIGAMVALAITAIIAKEAMFRWTLSVGKKVGSRVVVADAYHHRADAWSGIVSLVGVAGVSLGLPAADAIAGAVVSAAIVRMGAGVLKGSVLEFFDYQSKDLAFVRNAMHEALRQLKKKNVINCVVTRHGHKYILHMTVLVRSSDGAVEVAQLVEHVKTQLSSVVAVSDVLVSLVSIEDGEADKALFKVVKLLEAFHGLKGFTVDSEGKEFGLPSRYCCDCELDVSNVADLFGFNVIVIDSDTSVTKPVG